MECANATSLRRKLGKWGTHHLLPAERRAGCGSPPANTHNVTVIVSFTGDRFEQGIEVFQAGIFDDHATAAVLVFNRNFQAKGSLQ
jgi:hypothetical protein